ncbi:MAG: thermonuclease family protein [Planctomycetia bacterium]|nr:thermonuclease family protein [Planctomycetia bacterium]
MVSKRLLRRLEGLLILVILALLSSLLTGRNESGQDGEPGESTTVSSERDSSRSGRASSGGVQSDLPVPDRERCEVDWVVDGDTLIVLSRRGREKVRFIGCNCPETVKRDWPVEPYGPEASAYTKKRIQETGQEVTLVADGDRVDKYGRRLAMVYLGDEETASLINEELIELGLAKASLSYHYSESMKARFRRAQDTAKREGRGLWSVQGSVAP